MLTDSRPPGQKWIAGSLALFAVIFVCVRFLDIPVALFVKNHLYRDARWAAITSELPDLLLMLVLVVTLVACSLYLLRSKRGIFDTTTRFDKLVTWTAPASYLAKCGLKFTFGRVNTRCWLQEPGLYGFHWFQRRLGCDGFPSGHMIVIVALLAALWRFYPKSRPLCLLFASLLGVALVATNYHFLSDVFAGAYAGVLVETVVYRLLFRKSARFENSTA